MAGFTNSRYLPPFQPLQVDIDEKEPYLPTAINATINFVDNLQPIETKKPQTSEDICGFHVV
jgi:hypothetical protein